LKRNHAFPQISLNFISKKNLRTGYGGTHSWDCRIPASQEEKMGEDPGPRLAQGKALRSYLKNNKQKGLEERLKR
jgi:hypothetical protein